MGQFDNFLMSEQKLIQSPIFSLHPLYVTHFDLISDENISKKFFTHCHTFQS